MNRVIFDEAGTTKRFGRLLTAVSDLGQNLHGQGVINLEELRWSLQARRIEAKRLVEIEGKSERQAAKELGITKTQVRRDLGKDASGPKGTKNGPERTNGFIEDNPQERWQHTLAGFALDAIRLEAFFDEEFEGWRIYKAPQEVVQLVEQAQTAWNNIIGLIERVDND